MIRKILLSTALVAAAFGAGASTQTWNFDKTITDNSNGNELTFNQHGVSLTVSAWASTGDGCDRLTMSPNANDSDSRNDFDVDSCVESAKLVQNGSGNHYSGLGVINRDEWSGENSAPDHALDNANEPLDNGVNNHDVDSEMVLLSFSEAVTLQSISAGWRWGDSDSSILAFDEDSGYSTNFFSGHQDWADIMDAGWDLIQESPSFQSNSLAVSTTTYSRYWLVGAFNSVFGGHHDDGDDAFKFSGITTLKQPDTGVVTANAPATLAMFAGLVGLLLVRRKS